MPGGAFAHHAPGLGAADPFYAAFTTSAAWSREARRLADVEFRFTMRFRIWESPGEDAAWRAQAARLYQRRQAAIAWAADADHHLASLWTAASLRLEMIGPDDSAPGRRHELENFALEASGRWPI